MSGNLFRTLGARAAIGRTLGDGDSERGAEPVVVAEEDRPLYHAALAHGAGHLVTLVTEALDLLTAARVEHPARVLGPLLSAALEGALRQGDAALTGPVARGDAGTVAAHVEAVGASGVEGAPAPTAGAPTCGFF